jgi:MFS superfamily sulfate permease-like transporter
MPIPVLAAIVFVIGVELVDVRQMREIFVQRPSEFWVAAATAGIVVFIGVEQGILLAIFLSLLDHTRRGYKPSNTVLSVDKEGHWSSIPQTSRAQFLPGLIIYRFNHSMYYANSERFKAEVLDLIAGADPPLSWFCLDGAAVDDVDFSAAAALREVYGLLKQRGIRFALVEIQDGVKTELDRYKITELLGNQNLFKTVDDLKNAYEKSSSR